MKCFIMSDAMDQLEQRVSEFFMNAKKNKPEWREEQMASIKKVSGPWVIVSHNCDPLTIERDLKLGYSLGTE